MMKTSKISAFRGALLGALTLATSALAASSGTVAIGGTVTTTAAVDVGTPLTEATALDLNTASQQVVKVADLTVSTNNATGLTLTVSSGNMVKGDGNTPIPYQVTTVADEAQQPTSFAVASGTPYTVTTSAAGVVPLDLYVAYTPAENQDPGAYSATINLSVTDR